MHKLGFVVVILYLRVFYHHKSIVWFFFSSSFSTISQANNPPHTFLLQATSDATWIRNRQLVLRWGSLPRIIRGIAFRPGSSFFGCPLFNNPLRYIKSTTQKNRRAFYPDCTSTGTITRCTNLCQISAQTWNVSSNQWECKPGTRKLRERWRDTEGK